MSRCSQLAFPLFQTEDKRRTTHGDEKQKGTRKTARPIAVKKPMHVTLHTSYWLTPHRKFISELLKRESRKSGVRIFEKSLNSNHLHLGTQASTREGFKRLLSVISGKIAQKVTGSRKGNALEEPFWDKPIFTRIVEWGRAFRILIAYILKNQKEALGQISYTPRDRKGSSGP